MRLHTQATISTIVLWLFWLIPLQGKKLAPVLFDSSYIQWGSAIVVAVLIPVVLLISLRMLYDSGPRKTGLFFALLAFLPLVYNLVIYGVVGLLLARTQLTLLGVNERIPEAISTLTEHCHSDQEAEDREKSARMLYRAFGIQSSWKNEQGVLERYEP